jgi:osmotically-inducible protein OsmY
MQNELEVRFKGSAEAPTDEEVKKNIESLLSWNGSIRADDIAISLSDGFVTLQGSVTSYWESVKAEDLASSVKGVLNIRNNLAVVPSRAVHDKVIADDIIAALERNMNVNAEDIDVKVQKGRVSLAGTVSNWNAYHAVIDIAKHTRGVVDVQNKLGLILSQPITEKSP